MVHVLITSVIMGILAAGMMSIVLMQYRLLHRQAYGSMGEKYGEMSLSLMISFWSANQTRCESMAPSHSDAISYTCGGGPVGGCQCTCTPNNAFYPTITAAVDGFGNCQVTAAFERPTP
jgi:hypothetical protein